MDAKTACDKLNGFNFQNRYLVGECYSISRVPLAYSHLPVLYHQPEKMNRTENDLQKRQENLEKLKRQHGID
jgi:pre-mRNA branch site protein p14